MMNHLQPMNEGKSSRDHDRVQSPHLVTLERISGDINETLARALQEIVDGNLIGGPVEAHPLHQGGISASITAVEAIRLGIEDIEIDRQAHREEAVKTLEHKTKLSRLAKYTVDRFKK